MAIDPLKTEILNAVIWGWGNSTFMFDNRHAMFDRDGLTLAGVRLAALLHDADIDGIATIGVAGLPLGAAVKMAFPRPVTLHHVRDQKKDHGLGKLIEGPAPKPGARLWIVDDIVHGGKSFARCRDALIAEYPGVTIVGVAVLVDFRARANRQLTAQGYEVRSVYTTRSLGLARDQRRDKSRCKHVWTNLAVQTEPGDWLRSRPAISGDKLIVGTDRSGWLCCDRLTGEPHWQVASPKHRFKSTAGQPVIKVVGNNLAAIVAAYDGVIRALDIATGEPVWQNKIDSFVHSTPVLDGDHLYIGTEGRQRRGQFGDIVCLDTAGHEHWRFPTKGQIPCTPLVLDGMVVCGSNDKNVYALTKTGNLLWTVAMPAEVKGHLAAGPLIYAADNAGYLTALDRAGGVVWQRKLGRSLHRRTPIVYERLVIVPISEALVVACDAESGDIVWARRLRGKSACQIEVHGHHGYIVAEGGRLMVIDLDDGKSLWTQRLVKGATVSQAPVIVGKHLYLVTDARGLSCYEIGG